MDIDVAYANARQAAATFRTAQACGSDVAKLDFADQLATAFEAIDGWLQGGSYLPKSWAEVKA